MKVVITRIIYAVLIIINCIVIFNFSAEDGEKSSETSGCVVDKVVNAITNVNKKAKKEKVQEKATFIIRKLAHFSIYTLLGIWIMGEIETFKCSKFWKIIICLLLGMVYAISDEVHQSFVGGRSPQVRDVFIDTCGILFGCMILIGVYKITNCFINKFRLEKNGMRDVNG